jgi:hypothetical protein
MTLGLFHRLYYQGHDNYIYELGYNDSAGWDLNARKLCEAIPGTQLTAIVFIRHNSPEIRLYYFNAKGVLSEYSYSGGKWGSGATLPAQKCATNSRLSAFTFGEGPDIRVYYQTWDNALAESVFTHGHWQDGIHFA